MEITFYGDLRAYAIHTIKDDSIPAEAPVWIAIHPELLGCVAQGDSETEAIRILLTEVAPEYAAFMRERGATMPAPNSHLPITR